MKVLLLGRNYASVINSLHQGLSDSGVDVKSLSLDTNRSKFNNYDNIYLLRKRTFNNRILRFIQFIVIIEKLRKAIRSADIVHVFSDIDLNNRLFSNRFLLNVFFGKSFNGKKFITFLGSEVRNPKIELKKNKFYKYAYFRGDYEYPHETEFNSQIIQQKYSGLGFKLICSVETEIFINHQLFPGIKIYHHPSNVDISVIGTYKVDVKKIKIVHSPTAPTAKGTEHVLSAISELEKEGITNFEFTLLKGLDSKAYFKELAAADVYLDQFIWGWYGVATQQALQLGKVVVCYLSDERITETQNTPIINATIHDLKDVLKSILEKPDSFFNLKSNASKAYYNKYHSLDSVSTKVIEYYNNCNE